MAEKKTEAQAPQAKAEVFGVKEIAQNAPRLFGYSVDLAAAAFAYAGMEKCTLDEARKTIKAFAERKVE